MVVVFLQHNLTAMRGFGTLITQQSHKHAWFWYNDNTKISQPRMVLVYLGYNTTISQSRVVVVF
jgi:hypothetical protein